MFRYTIFLLKKHPATALIMVLGFLIASFILSLGISSIRRQYDYIMDSTSGPPDDQLLITTTIKNSDNAKAILKNLKNIGEVQVISSGKQRISSNGSVYSAQVVPVWFFRTESWHIPLISGRYFDVQDMDSNDNNLIVGKIIAKRLNINTGDNVRIGNSKEKCTIIGITGRNYRDTQWDNVIYMSYNTYSRLLLKLPKGKNTIVLKSGKNVFIHDKKRSENVDYQAVEADTDRSGFHNAIKITSILGFSVFIIAILNISNLMLYWVYERQHFYAMLRVLGARKKDVFLMVIKEAVFIAIIGNLMALLLQLLLSVLYTGLPFELHWYNFSISLLITTASGILAAITPGIYANKIPVSKLLNEGEK